MYAKRIITLCLLLTLVGSNIPASAQEENTSLFQVTKFILRNGLQVILSEDFSLPVVSVAVSYKVGSINESTGKTGRASLLQRLMYQGSRNVGRMQHINFINRVGGRLSAITPTDKTIYFQTIPSNQLALVLWLESDRMNSLNITASKVEQFKERNIQEIKSSNKADPYLTSSDYFNSLLYPDFAYHHSPRGLESDIRNITLDDMIRFYTTYYKPNNAVLCITGYFNKSRTQALIQKYFGTIPMGKNIPPHPKASPVEKENIQKTIENPYASLPGFYIGYRIASPHLPDYYPLKIIEYILLRGKASRLHKRLRRKTRIIAHSLAGGIEIRNDLAVFKIFVTCNNEAMVKLSKREVFSEINRLKSSLISREELLKAKNMFKMDFTNQYATSADKAIFLIDAEFAGLELTELTAELEKYLSVSPSDISGILNRYFSDDYILLDINIK